MKFFAAIFFSLAVAAASDSSTGVRHLEDDTAVCTNGKEFTDCGSACPETCDSVQSGETIICITVCVPGCFCPTGTVDSGTACVQREECLVTIDITCANVLCSSGTRCIETTMGPQCVPNDVECTNGMTYVSCGSACPPPTCATIGQPILCPAVCVPLCICPVGTVASDEGCIKREEPRPFPVPSDFPCESGTTCVDTPSGPECQPDTECTDDKVYNECGSACPATCDNIGVPIPCPAVCVQGCFCPVGTVASGDKCIKPEDCPPTLTCANVDCTIGTTCVETPTGPQCQEPEETECTDGKVYNGCGSACPATCDNIGEPIFCITVCVPGCFCPVDTVASGDKCVKKEDCPPKETCTTVECPRGSTCVDSPTGPECQPDTECTDDKVYNECGSACPATCDAIDDPILCIALCVPGCFCPVGTVASGDKCIKPEDCPNATCKTVKCERGTTCVETPTGPECQPDTTECTADKVYNECGSACPTTCDNIGVPIACPAVCVPGCFCPAGTVESGDKCVKPEDCCTDDKVYKECGSACPTTCDNIGKPISCIDLCVTGCFCPVGTVASGDKCIKSEDCPPTLSCANVDCTIGTTCVDTPTGPECQPDSTTECTDDKVYTECGSACPATCDTVGDLIACPAVCVPGCFCPAGTVESGDKCVKPDDCPPPLTCRTVRCGRGTTCVETRTGPVCQPDTPPDDYTAWYEYIQENYTGSLPLRICGKVQSGIKPTPNTGDKCSKKSKTCFFGNQACGELAYPQRQCDCVDAMWSCTDPVACP